MPRPAIHPGEILADELAELGVTPTELSRQLHRWEVKSGKLKGTEFILDKFMAKGFPSIAIGSSPLKSEIVLPDPDIAPQHAMLSGDGMHFALKDMSMAGTYIENRKVERVQLVNGQRIRMGNTELVYHEKR